MTPAIVIAALISSPRKSVVTSVQLVPFQWRAWSSKPKAHTSSSARATTRLAENVGTATGTWIYSGQVGGQLVSFAKIGSWYLLLYVAFVTVTLVTRRALSDQPLDLTETRAIAEPP